MVYAGNNEQHKRAALLTFFKDIYLYIIIVDGTYTQQYTFTLCGLRLVQYAYIYEDKMNISKYFYVHTVNT